MKNGKVVLIAITFPAGGIDTVECLGIFNGYTEAYGEAACHLSEAADYSSEKLVITPIFELEAETGFGMALKKDGGKEGAAGWMECCYILEAPPENETEPHDASYVLGAPPRKGAEPHEP